MNIVLVDAAVMPPGSCYLTGSSVGPFIDTGYQIDDLADTGRVYLAESTVADLAGLLGYAPPRAWQQTQSELRLLRAALIERDELIHVLRASIETLVAAGFTPVDPPPAASAEGVLEWVHARGETEVPDRAREAFLAETQEPHPRAALLRALGPLFPHEESDNVGPAPHSVPV